MVGGGLRQVGVLGAAGLFALEHHVGRLAEDHTNALRLAQAIADMPGLECPHGEDASKVWTNLVYFNVTRPALDAAMLTSRLQARGVLSIPLGVDGRRIRMVTHLDVSSADIDLAIDALQSVLNET
jgi:threonine aldolase